MTDYVEETRKLLGRVHDECLNQLEHLRFDPDGDNQVVTISLYCSLVEYVGALLALTDKQRRTGFSPVFRSYLEGCAELKNLLSDGDFYFRKEAMYHREWFAGDSACQSAK